jgi:hypothetical protein
MGTDKEGEISDVYFIFQIPVSKKTEWRMINTHQKAIRIFSDRKTNRR